MKLAYLDCAAGIAGDMCLGALIDAGVPLDYLTHHLKSLGIDNEFTLQVQSVRRCGQPALHAVVDVLSDQPPQARHWPEIRDLIDQAELPPAVKTRSLQVFHHLAEAEAKVHEESVDQVHFHEVGAVDALVDVVGTCLGFDWLQVERILCSPQPIGGGWVQTEHGRLAVPVPAVIQLWEDAQVPLLSNGIDAELVTPTGAAISTTLATEFGDCPPMQLHRIGRGAGTRELPIPNVLRLWIGESHGSDLTETVAVLETQIDDLNPQVIAYMTDQLLTAGALDVFTQAITMKQGRPGMLVTVLCLPDQIPMCETIIFSETTTLGIRRSLQQRSILSREMDQVSTEYGEIGMKVACRYGQVINVQPEFRDCVAKAQQFHLPVQTVWLAAQAAWKQTHG